MDRGGHRGISKRSRRTSGTLEKASVGFQVDPMISGRFRGSQWSCRVPLGHCRGFQEELRGTSEAVQGGSMQFPGAQRFSGILQRFSGAFHEVSSGAGGSLGRFKGFQGVPVDLISDSKKS